MRGSDLEEQVGRGRAGREDGLCGRQSKRSSCLRTTKEARKATCQCAKDESEEGGANAAADEFAVVGGRISGERVGDGGKNCSREAVKSSPERTGEKFWLEGGQDSDEKADGGVGEKEAGRKKCGGLKRDSLEPRAKGGEKAKEAASPDRAPRNVHGLRMPKGEGGGKSVREKSLRVRGKIDVKKLGKCGGLWTRWGEGGRSADEG